MKNFLIISFLLLVGLNGFGQSNDVLELNQEYFDWFNKDLETESIVGTSVNKAYLEFLKEKKSKKKITVAVIDSGVDTGHIDLVGKIWVNTDEIPNNNIDDDSNGYVDDINGWNFLGNSKGENINYESFECTRVISRGKQNNPYYIDAKKLYDIKFEKARELRRNLDFNSDYVDKLKRTIYSETGIEILSVEDLRRINSQKKEVLYAKKMLERGYKHGFEEKDLLKYKKYSDEYLHYFLNPQFKPRHLIGDDQTDILDSIYGNPNVKGPRSDHGTPVAGIIGAIRNNNIGINGIATNVDIMCLRAVPNGDERDKDIALAIRYAVNNGAHIINMSFGKGISPNKEFVFDAIKYAEKNGVLLVAAAGNDALNVDSFIHYPSAIFPDGERATNYITVGASNIKQNKNIAAEFSNYGKKTVDIFAPGVNIISLDSSNTYSLIDGTSFAAPVFTGVAALLLSYYPELKPEQIKNILLKSSFPIEEPYKIYLPYLGDKRKKQIEFKYLSVSGGIVNAYNALLEAERLSLK